MRKLVFLLLLCSACSQNSVIGKSNTPVDTTKLNLNPKALSKEGCLNIETLRDELTKFPEGAKLRQWTSNYEMQPVNEEAAIRRGFLALNAFSNYKYAETESRFALRNSRELASISQSGCESVIVHSKLEGKKKYTFVTSAELMDEPVEPTSEANKKPKEKIVTAHLEAEDGSTMTWTLRGPRELEITTVSQVMDPCPHYEKATASATIELVWGSEEELKRKPAVISRRYLRTMSTAVLNMPEALLSLGTYSDEDKLVKAKIRDLAKLRSAEIDPQIHQCPYRANPPSGDEPPPSTEDSSPRPPEPEVPDAALI